MRSYKRIGYLILVILLVSATITVVAAIRSKSQNQQKKEIKVLRRADKTKVQPSKQEIDESETPIADYNAPEPTDRKERAKKEAKGKKYRRYADTISPGTIQAGAVYHWPQGFSELPISQSDAVIVGEVSDAKAFLTNNKTTVYSDFTIHLDEVLKGDSQTPLSQGSTVIADRPGGRVHFPSGSAGSFSIAGWGLPRVGHRYVLFLKRDQLEQDYSIVTGYELRENHVYPLDKSTSSETNFDIYANSDESIFLEKIRSAVANPSSSASK